MNGGPVMDKLFYTTRSYNAKGELVSNSNYNPISLEKRDPQATGFLSARRLTDSKYEQYTDDEYYLLWDGYRIPGKGDKAEPHHLDISIYKEELNLNTPQGTIHATAIYPDAGKGSDTTISNVEFAVIGATGSFSGAQSILIEYSNDGSMPWARDADNNKVPNARRMTVIGPRATTTTTTSTTRGRSMAILRK